MSKPFTTAIDLTCRQCDEEDETPKDKNKTKIWNI